MGCRSTEVKPLAFEETLMLLTLVIRQTSQGGVSTLRSCHTSFGEQVGHIITKVQAREKTRTRVGRLTIYQAEDEARPPAERERCNLELDGSNHIQINELCRRGVFRLDEGRGHRKDAVPLNTSHC